MNRGSRLNSFSKKSKKPLLLLLFFILTGFEQLYQHNLFFIISVTFYYGATRGLKYSCNGNIDLTLSLGYSFRFPFLEERFQYVDQGSYVRVGNPNLKAEKGKSVDFGFRCCFPNFKFVSSIFYNRFNDLVTEIPGTFEEKNAFVKTNIGEAQLNGFDLHSECNFLTDNIFYLTASYVIGDDFTVKSNLPAIPPLNGLLGMKFQLSDYLNIDISSTIFAAQKKSL